MQLNERLILPKTRITNSFTYEHHIELDILRLDLLHPIISGNKFFKLKYPLKQALQEKREGILSFGGAYSNHLHALAFAANRAGLKSVGIIRGEKPSKLSATLEDCMAWRMQLQFVSRDAYRHKTDEEVLQQLQKEFPHYLIVPEGGSSAEGIKGAEEIYTHIGSEYSHIAVAVGTATTLRGIAKRANAKQQVLGFSALKNAFPTYQPIAHEQLIQEYHFGGFAKHTPELKQFMNDFRQEHQVELDFIYTAKMMFGIFDLIQQGYFETGAKVLMVHSGGLQGNRGIYMNA